MKTVYKYKLKEVISQHVQLPKNSELLTVQMQDGEVFLWAKVDTNEEMESKLILLCCTGEDIGQVGKYIGTCQIGRAFVVHVFEGLD